MRIPDNEYRPYIWNAEKCYYEIDGNIITREHAKDLTKAYRRLCYLGQDEGAPPGARGLAEDLIALYCPHVRETDMMKFERWTKASRKGWNDEKTTGA